MPSLERADYDRWRAESVDRLLRRHLAEVFAAWGLTVQTVEISEPVDFVQRFTITVTLDKGDAR